MTERTPLDDSVPPSNPVKLGLADGRRARRGAEAEGWADRVDTVADRLDQLFRFVTPTNPFPSLGAHVGGLALAFLAVGMIISALVELGAGGTESDELLVSSGIVAGIGLLVWRATTVPKRVSVGAAFLAVLITWVAASIGGAVPYLVSDVFPRPDDALFESISGFTGTGSTVLSPIEGNARGILFWRSMTQWFGGMGMVVLAVAVLPFLGVGGLDLVAAEAPGPTSDRLAPRVSETAKRLWLVYGGFTLISIAAMLLVGMSTFDAVVHAFTIVSTGGLSPYDSSVGHFDSVAVELAIVVLMLVGGTSFTLHWRAITGEPGAYRRSAMFRWYIGVYVAFTAAIMVLLLADGFTIAQATRDAAFNVATLITSTGFGTADFTMWVPAAQLLLVVLMVTGGMSGSTSGGAKLLRVRIVLLFARREMRQVRHPRAVLPVKMRDGAIPEAVVGGVAGFIILYFLVITAGTAAVALLGADIETAFGGVVSAMGNMGPGLNESGPASNFLVYSRPARGVIMVVMLAGRLEVLPLVLGIAHLTRPLRRSARHAVAGRTDTVIRTRSRNQGSKR